MNQLTDTASKETFWMGRSLRGKLSQGIYGFIADETLKEKKYWQIPLPHFIEKDAHSKTPVGFPKLEQQSRGEKLTLTSKPGLSSWHLTASGRSPRGWRDWEVWSPYFIFKVSASQQLWSFQNPSGWSKMEPSLLEWRKRRVVIAWGWVRTLKDGEMF